MRSFFIKPVHVEGRQYLFLTEVIAKMYIKNSGKEFTNPIKLDNNFWKAVEL